MRFLAVSAFRLDSRLHTRALASLSSLASRSFDDARTSSNACVGAGGFRHEVASVVLRGRLEALTFRIL
eukprot:2095961-Pleurochrysis_carterae.AAC.2